MFEHANADLIQVFEETVEDWYQISCCQLVPQDNRQLVYGKSQCTPHLPLRAREERKGRKRIITPSMNRKRLLKHPFSFFFHIKKHNQITKKNLNH